MRLNCGEDNGVRLAEEPREIPPASPASLVVRRFAGLSCGRYYCGDRASGDGYRPPRQIPPADRLPRNESLSRAFSPIRMVAVDAVGILASFPDGL
jgi:hypothetical protein